MLACRFFGDIESLNWKGKIFLIFKEVVVGLGIKSGEETYFFSVLKQ